MSGEHKSTEQIYYELGLGVAARVCETMAAAIEAAEKSGDEIRFAKDSVGALRSAAGIIRAEETNWAAERLEAHRKASDER